jgi:Spy/CpxP family protein refolding chaperone
MVIGILAAGAVSVAAVGAAAFGGHGPARHAIGRRVMAAVVDEALDRAKASAEQRAAIHAARDRVLVAIEAERAAHRGRVQEGLALFEAETLDPARVEALQRDAEAARGRVREAVRQALVEAHGVLTAEQRRAVADFVREHRFARGH